VFRKGRHAFDVSCRRKGKIRNGLKGVMHFWLAFEAEDFGDFQSKSGRSEVFNA
jgi:hypothetical protein